MRNRRASTSRLHPLRRTNLQTICHILGRLMTRRAPDIVLRRTIPGVAAATAMARPGTIAEALLKSCAI
jgi:hypothetical protein